MCGIFGLASNQRAAFDPKEVHSLLNRLFLLSESRGKDACGIALADTANIRILKRPIRARHLVHSDEYLQLVQQFSSRNDSREASDIFALVGHARMVTNGSEETHQNNQPVIKRGMVCLHNGIVVNDKDLWATFPELEREFEVDTEVVLELIAYYRYQCQMSLAQAINMTFQQIKGANSIALLSNDLDGIALASSNGSLYFARSASAHDLLFASERYILEQALHHKMIAGLFGGTQIVQVKPNEGYIFTLSEMQSHYFLLGTEQVTGIDVPPGFAQMISDILPMKPRLASWRGNRFTVSEFSENDRFMARVKEAVSALQRCLRCLLPETFPFISFDEDGICNYCRNYHPLQWKGEEALEQLAAQYHSTSGAPDVLVPLSGGRDSSFGIHYIKNVLNLNPIAYTYDWGMVTDLARRNISRMCGQLGIEHILLSANIRQKRSNIRMNVQTWLNQPDLGTVPLFMAGDKQFFYYASMLKKQMNIGLVLFSMNPLERTDFKVGLCGINEGQPKKKHYSLNALNQIWLSLYYARQFVINPAYINSSLMDSVFAFFSYYMIPKDYETLYDYVRWDETTVSETLIDEYDWEVAEDTQSTWRIGDGTASFYNYIYYVMGGFSENDTFRSNQIREGMLTREEGMRLIERDNMPRYESIKWYCDTINIDFRDAIKAINAAPKRYLLS